VTAQPAGIDVRLLSYNVRSLRDDAGAVAAVIRACAPDVVCVQEAPRFLRWRSRCAELARASGLLVVTGGRSAGAMLLLASMRSRVLHREDVLLAKAPRRHQRGLAIAVLGFGPARLAVASMHLSLDAEERLRQVPEVLGHLERVRAQWDASVALAGDVNASPGRPAWQALTGELRDAYSIAPWGGERTSPARAPVRRIDGVFVGADVEVVRCGAPEVRGGERASDHLPVLADLRLPPAAEPSHRSLERSPR
jgi:endonuclease/exonuclease/phosphatase family metal-dependent hydrolase